MRISVMLAVQDAQAAAEWYEQALGATRLWDLGSVVGLEIAGAPFFLGQPQQNGWESPPVVGTTTTRIEVFLPEPDAFFERALAEGAVARSGGMRDHEMPWGQHRQASFFDPFGHLWLVGDESPLQRLGNVRSHP